MGHSTLCSINKQILSSLHLYHWKKLDQGTAWSWRESSSLCSLSCRNCSSITACKRKNQKGWEWCISSALPRSLFCCFSFYITTHTSSISFVPSHLWVAESHQSAAQTKHCKAKMNARSTAESKKQENVKTLKNVEDVEDVRHNKKWKSHRLCSFRSLQRTHCFRRSSFTCGHLKSNGILPMWPNQMCQIQPSKWYVGLRWFEMDWVAEWIHVVEVRKF